MESDMEGVALVVCRNEDMHAGEDSLFVIRDKRTRTAHKYHVIRLVYGYLIWKDPPPDFCFQFLTGTTNLQSYALRKGLCAQCEEIEEKAKEYLESTNG